MAAPTYARLPPSLQGIFGITTTYQHILASVLPWGKKLWMPAGMALSEFLVHRSRNLLPIVRNLLTVKFPLEVL